MEKIFLSTKRTSYRLAICAMHLGSSEKKFSSKTDSVIVDLWVVLTCNGLSHKWAFQQSNRKCLFIAGACTRLADSRAQDEKIRRRGCLLLTDQVRILMVLLGHSFAVSYEYQVIQLTFRVWEMFILIG